MERKPPGRPKGSKTKKVQAGTLLYSMRKVLKGNPVDDNDAEKSLRKFLDSDPAKFMKQMHDLETAEIKESRLGNVAVNKEEVIDELREEVRVLKDLLASKEVSDEEGEDAGADRIRSVIADLLERHHREG